MAKTIENKKVTISFERLGQSGVEEVGVDTTYFELIFNSCKKPNNQQEGYSWDEIEKINRIKEYYLQSKMVESISVEDADISFIVDKVSKKNWASFDKNLLEFKKYIEKLT